MKCGMCGYEFDPAQAETACSGCPLARGCRLVRCPRCGYEMPPEAALVRWVKGIKTRYLRTHPPFPGREGGKVVENWAYAGATPPAYAQFSAILDGKCEVEMRISESAQEILERLWMAEEDGKAGLALADPDLEGMDELVQGGLVTQDGAVWRLTQAGEPEAALAIRRHRLGERLLTDVLKAEDELLEEQACRLEHALFDGLDESICTLLGHPQFCPHGKPIPPGNCCRQMRATVGRLIAPLSEVEPGKGGEVAYIQMGDASHLQKLMALGVLPGGKIRLVRNSPSFVFECGYSQFAVDEAIAADIYVRLQT